MKFLDRFQEQFYALFRIVIGFLFLWHGTQKFFNFPLEFPWPLNPMLYTAGAIELVAGILIMVGFFTRPAAFIASGTMAAAYWMAHGSKEFFPIANGGELAIMFCFGFLLIASRGAGIWGIDKD
ncbi:MAG TPA: LuxR family transcriptional regulator [Colwellia sp.]|jgi:putative oxidoreductase|nr:LuxR family transcriptional regulator [Colwellia sp.]